MEAIPEEKNDNYNNTGSSAENRSQTVCPDREAIDHEMQLESTISMNSESKSDGATGDSLPSGPVGGGRYESRRPYIRKSFQELNLCDDFLFAKTMQDPDILKPVLETILRFKIARVEIVDTQKSFDVSYHAHGVRLDVYADDEAGSRFAVEMQTRQEYNILKRSRYYHSIMDIDELLKGREYDELKNNYVIFICAYTLFDGQLHQYNFQNRCSQIPDLSFSEGRETILLSTEGTADDITPDLRAFLQYVKSSTDETAARMDSDLIRKIHDKVKKIRQNRQLEVEYLKFEELMRESRTEGLSEGISEGIQAFIAEFSEEGFSKERIVQKLVKRFSLSPEDAESRYDAYIASIQ